MKPFLYYNIQFWHAALVSASCISIKGKFIQISCVQKVNEHRKIEVKNSAVSTYSKTISEYGITVLNPFEAK